MKAYYLTVNYKTYVPDSLGFVKIYRCFDETAAKRIYEKYQMNNDIEWATLDEVEV